MKIEVTREILGSYKNILLSNANEASTRLKVIDRILRDVLGWLDEDISPEEHVTEDGSTTYSDYILKTANAAIVVEAKKVGASFSITPGNRRVKLSNSFLQSELGEAIIQARDYARKFAIDFAVATNGATWAIFPAQRHDQVKFNDSTALVFWSLDELLNESYQEFYDLLSRESVISGSLETALLGRVANQTENRKLGSFFASNARQGLSNPIFPIIEQEVITAFSDSVVDLDDDSFERCYVATPETMKFDHKIRMHITRRESPIGGSTLRPMRSRDAEVLFKKVQVSAGNNQKSLAILLLGTVGAGKTTFLHYMRKVRLKELFITDVSKPYPHWLHLDFLVNSPSISATEFIFRSLRDYINEDPFLSDSERCIKHAYSSDIKALRKVLAVGNASEEEVNKRINDTIMDDYQKVNPYVERILQYATGKTPFFLVIDNVDQIEDEEIQSRLLTEAFAIARSLSLNLVLSLRQSTFTKHRNSPVIDAFDFEAVQIDPPRIASVLSKRFSLVKHLASGKKGEFIAENGARVQVEDASQIVDLLQGSVLGTEIGTRIEVLATEDVRLALRMTREFLERGYTNPGRAIEYHKHTGKYILPRHEAFRAIILGTKPVYSEESSPIGNPFDSKISINQAQPLRLFVLASIVAYASESNFVFIDGATICENLRRIGFGDSYTERILGDLCKHRFLFTANHGDPTIASSFVPSRFGGYVIRELLANFTFIENMMFDTYISDIKAWQELRDLSHKIEAERDTVARLRYRVRRAEVFYNYMHESLKPIIVESHKRGLPAQWCSDPLEERSIDFRNELSRVLASARRNYGKNGRKQITNIAASEHDEDFTLN